MIGLKHISNSKDLFEKNKESMNELMENSNLYFAKLPKEIQFHAFSYAIQQHIKEYPPYFPILEIKKK